MSELTDERLWRVQVLPLGTISYRNREKTFDRGYLEAIVSAFDGDAYDRVSFQDGSTDGVHTNDPGRWRGDVRRLEVVPDGLDAVIAVTAEGDELIRTTPGLAAAPRLVEDYRRHDGREFRVAMQHVLATRTPMITGLRPWRAVEAVTQP